MEGIGGEDPICEGMQAVADSSEPGILTQGGKEFRPVDSEGSLEGLLGLFFPSPRRTSI